MLAGKHILVLEEQPLIAQLLGGMLSEMECEVVGPASRIPAALDLLAENEVDAAIIDVKIKGEPSFPLADELIARGIPWAFTSANNPNGVSARYPRVLVITKPYSEYYIQEVLTVLLGDSSIPDLESPAGAA